MSNVVGNIGDLTNLIATAVATWGSHLITASQNPGQMNDLANAWYSSTTGNYGVIYFWNEKILWFIGELNKVTDYTGFQAFLQALADAGIL